jgi:hypothetical protein
VWTSSASSKLGSQGWELNEQAALVSLATNWAAIGLVDGQPAVASWMKHNSKEGRRDEQRCC